jgi:predicted subunit of tRNA(5-methylaminomethyl-2-thiouridylate) methyltransferase
MITAFGDRDFDPGRGPATVLFSGGVDSTLAAIRVGRRHPKVHLLTGLAPGLSAPARAATHVQRLARFYADPGRFEHHVLPVDALARALSQGSLAAARRFGLVALSPREILALAFHARALAFCLERGVTVVADGTVRGKSAAPACDPELFVEPLRALYAAHGVRYETPVLDDGATSEATLWALRYSRHELVRGRPDDQQVQSDFGVLQAMVDALRGSGPEAREKARGFLADRLAAIDAWVRACASGADARLLFQPAEG